MRGSLSLGFALLLTLLAALVPAHGRAFCGFYVSGAEGSLYANATMVVMMRDGQRTVLSMQNDYSGPPQDFAMVVPVPVVLSEDNVRTLPHDIFGAVDRLASPRLVEYWETDPCNPQPWPELSMRSRAGGGGMELDDDEGGGLGVRVEAEFAVGEYDIVILSASDSSGLETWLHREHYNIPEGAGEVLRPYVESGTKFFVARVDVERVTFVTDASGARRALLSPLRVHYDTPEFSLPVRLGLLNSSGTQDLLVHILARGRRFEVANYENVFIPTNMIVPAATRSSFASFYEGLLTQTLAAHPRSVITEYSWSAGTCDPCPTEPLSAAQLMTLGADVVGPGSGADFTLTRLHYRYTREDLGEDLVFRAAPPMEGGRGIPGTDGTLSTEVTSSYGDQFQGRYIMLNPWEGELACESPERGRWGGPPGTRPGAPRAPVASAGSALLTGAVTPPPVQPPSPAVEETPVTPTPATAPPAAAPPEASSSCAGCALAGSRPPSSAWLLVLGLALGLAARARRRR